MSDPKDGAEYLPDEGEIDDYAFAVRNPSTGEVIKIYPDGQISGFPLGFTLIDNRVPELVGRAAGAGYSEAMSRIADARRQMFDMMIKDMAKWRK